MMFDLRLASKILCSCFAFAIGIWSFGLAQEKPPQPSSIPVVDWQAIVIPESNDPKELAAFIESTKRLQPIKPEHYIEMQRSLRTVAKKLVESLEDRKSPLFKKAEEEFVNASVMLLGNEGPDAQRNTFDRFRTYLKDRETIEFMDIQMAVMAGANLEQLSDYSLAKEAYKTFAEIFRGKDATGLAEVIASLEANARRLELPGNVFPLVGTTFSEEDFRIESLRGKIVLIYFWTSTTRACEQEHPYMLAVYNKYKERGFEIVGIGLDEKKDAAQAFLKKLSIPWINLWESRKNGVSKVMETYGVNAIPTLFLLDKEGKVITIEARGLLLGKALEQLLPEP